MLVVFYVILGVLSAVFMLMGFIIFATTVLYKRNELPEDLKSKFEDSLEKRSKARGGLSNEENLKQIKTRSILLMIPMVNIVVAAFSLIKKFC